MDFVLKIFFSGLMAFVPSSDGKELTVLLVHTPHEYAMADGTALAEHKALLLARAGRCEGTCVTNDHPSIAQFMYADKLPQQAQTALNSALLGGGAWRLSSSELSLVGPEEPLMIRTGARGMTDGVVNRVPRSAAEREDFSWIADVSDLAPGTNGFKAAVTSSDPPPGCMVAARLKLRSGKVFTYAVVKIDGKARPVYFRKPSGEGPEAPYVQAVATWVAAEIRVPGEFVEIVDQNFSDSERRRSMRLYPQENLVEIAVVNFPPFLPPPADQEPPIPQPGQHFQIYYDLVRNPPARAARLVPHAAPSAAEPQTDWGALHPRVTLWSDLLEQLGLSPRSKSPYELALCPIVKD